MIEPKKIKEINFSDNIYFIPSYQRGYRWDKKQVEELLDDIYEVYVTKQESYCLQPIVVSKIDENKYEIIDGQQRLTTLYLILMRLSQFSRQLFQLDFENVNRKNCTKFFNDLKQDKFDYSNPDFAHISNAYKTIVGWFDKKIKSRENSDIEFDFYGTLSGKVEVIWYDVEENNRKELVKVFTRLNSGKIGLTNAELIKALFLSRVNFENQSKDIYTHQLDISNKWNQIENTLQNDDFWNFINKSENKLATRIDYIFQLIVRNKDIEIKEEFDVFRYYYPLYVRSQESKKYDFIETNWNEIDLYFTILQDWHSHQEYYHLIGLLIWDGADILILIKKYQESNKTSFVKYLFKEIESRFCNLKLEELFYPDKQIERLLVFFNVMEVYRSKNNKFPFKQLKLEEIKWSLEHIHPQNALDVKQSEYSQWLEDHKKVLIAIDSDKELIDRVVDLIAELKDTNTKNLKLQFEDLSREILENLDYKENNKESISNKSNILFEKLGGEHHISNMAMLDTKKNSSLGNSAFGVKRKSIIDFELNGFYIPIATKNSFLKYYSDYPKHLNYWTLEDRDEYLFKIQEQMNFVKTQNL